MLPLILSLNVATVGSGSGSGSAALYPPRGWNSYDSYTWKVSEKDVRATRLISVVYLLTVVSCLVCILGCGLFGVALRRP